jgi:hypothetical protein
MIYKNKKNELNRFLKLILYGLIIFFLIGKERKKIFFVLK